LGKENIEVFRHENQSQRRHRGANGFQSLATVPRWEGGSMKNVLTFAVILEAGFALALLIVPSLIMQLLLGEQLTGIAIPLARVAGLALIGLAIACWPGPPPVGMMTYCALVTLYLAYLGFTGYTGVLLWPVVILHVILTVFLAREVMRLRRGVVE
jgi:hypothetical protein